MCSNTNALELIMSIKLYLNVITHNSFWINITESEDEDEEMEVRFSQWGSTDRADIIKEVLPVTEFVNLLVEKIDALTTHSFIAKTKGDYVKQLKESLKEGEFVVLGDFAENHGFIIQVKFPCKDFNQNIKLHVCLKAISNLYCSLTYLKEVYCSNMKSISPLCIMKIQSYNSKNIVRMRRRVTLTK